LYTIGQGKGLGMTYHEKLFVIKIDAGDNTVWVGEEIYLLKSEIDIIETQWLTEIEDGEEYQVKIRYQQQGSPARIFKTAQGFKLKFSEAQRAVTPGQAAVLYKNQQLVGGGWITLN
jgi:tRNA-uridine 2-sulfurtransferase